MFRTLRHARLPIVAALLLLGLIFTLSTVNRVQWIEGSLPYPRHVDERFVTAPALRILQSGSLDPGFFRYPSLPIYLASAGMRLGAAISIARGELESLDEIESVGRPYYSPPMVMRVPRIVHTVLTSATLLLVAAIGYRMRASAMMLVLPPAALAINRYYHSEGWLYLNVDMIASFFALAATLQILRATERPSFRALVVGPAILCGGAAASKYPSGLILLPALLAISWYAPLERQARWAITLILGAGAAFVLFCPYSVLRFDLFQADVLHELGHYATGRALHEGNPGLEQMVFYGEHLLQVNGPAILLLAGIGWLAALREDWRRAVLLALFPISIFLLLSAQRVHFHRNLVPAYGILAVAAGLGIHTLSVWLIDRLRFARRPRLVRCAVATGVVLLVVATIPPGNFHPLRPDIDPRKRATAWIESSLPAGGTVVVSSSMTFAAQGLPDSIQVLRQVNDDAPLQLAEQDCYIVAPSTRARATDPESRRPANGRSAWLARHSFATPVAEFGKAPWTRSDSMGGQLGVQILPCRAEAPEEPLGRALESDAR